MGVSMAAFLFSLVSSFLGSCAFSVFSLSVTFCLIYLQSWVVVSLPSALWLLRYSFISHSLFVISWFFCSHKTSENKIRREQKSSDGKVTACHGETTNSSVCSTFPDMCDWDVYHKSKLQPDKAASCCWAHRYAIPVHLEQIGQSRRFSHVKMSICMEWIN